MALEKKNKKAKPTAADKAAARFIRRKLRDMGDQRPTQDWLVSEWTKGGGRGSQSAMSQYINGGIPHNLRSVTFFASVLKCDPREIYPDLPGLANVVSPAQRDEVRDAPLIPRHTFLDDELVVLDKLVRLPDDMRDSVIDVITNAFALARRRVGRTRLAKELEPKK